MYDCTETQAVCRGCGRKLLGSPSWKAGFARHPEPKGQVYRCHYGGWVCSRSCDVRACVALEQSMPGCGTIRSYQQLSPYAKESIGNHWPEAT